MMKNKRTLMAGALLCWSLCSWAGAPSTETEIATATTPEAKQLAIKLAQLYPGTHFTSVKPAPIAPLFEVTMGRNLAYVEPSGRHFFFGHLYDMQANRDLTADLAADLNRVDVGSLPITDAIVVTKGDGKRVVNVFSDPGCHYCQQLEKVFDGMTDIRIQTWLIPLQPGSDALAKSIWCASDKARAWRDWMLSRTESPPATVRCNSDAIQRNLELARRLQAVGTPTLISANGRVHSGAMSREELAAWLALDQPSANGAISTKE
jgi:thiol:disulfide interchange protein DsbC